MKHAVVAALSAALFITAGCGDSSSTTCDADEVDVDGTCRPAVTKSADGGVPEDGSSEATGGMCTEDEGGTFGATCTDNETHAECGCPTDYCAIQPGNPEGYCTATGCIENPDVCPEGWTCFDLSMFDPTLPSFCMQP